MVVVVALVVVVVAVLSDPQLVREFQQRESEDFMVLFRHRMIVHQVCHMQ